MYGALEACCRVDVVDVFSVMGLVGVDGTRAYVCAARRGVVWCGVCGHVLFCVLGAFAG